MSQEPPKPARVDLTFLYQTKAGRTVGSFVLLAALCQVLPYPALRFVPDDAFDLLPRLLRWEVDPLPWSLRPSEALAATPVDDETLLELPVASVDEPPTPTPSLVKSSDYRAPIVLQKTCTLDSPLPPMPSSRSLSPTLVLLPIEDPHAVMSRFYASLAETAGGKGQTRVLHYGDSLITGDYITQTIRRLMQKKFGDSGPGFVLAGKPSPWYRRNNVEVQVGGEWHTHRLTKPGIGDGAYGLGAVTFRTSDREAFVSFELPGRGELNKTITDLDIFHLAMPRGGRFEVSVDGEVLSTVDTEASAIAGRVSHFDLSDGPHAIRLRPVGGGEVRLFGLALERDVPGIVYDSLGLDGTRAKLLERFGAGHWEEQIRARRPNLLVLHYGTNEGEAEGLASKNYRDDLLAVVRRLRLGVPEVPCLLIGPMDRADTDDSGKLVSRPVVQRIADVQRRVAYMEGCAYFDTWRAMGGEGSMARWYKSGLGGGDLTHPTRQGAERLGVMIFTSLLDGYRRHLSAQAP